MAVSRYDITSMTSEDPDAIASLFMMRRGIRSLGQLTTLVNLKELSLAFNNLQSIQGVAQLPQLQLLDCSFNQLTSLSGIEQLPRLTTLNVSHNKLSSSEPLQNLTGLERLCLHNNAITTPAALLPLSQLQGLTALTLKGNPVIKAATNYAAATARLLPNLRVLDKLNAAALLAVANQDSCATETDSGHSSSSSWQELAEQQVEAAQAAAAAKQVISGSQRLAGGAADTVKAVVVPTTRTTQPRAAAAAGSPGASKPTHSSSHSSSAVSGDTAVNLQEMQSIRYPDNGMAATIRMDGSAMVHWPSGRLAASLELQAGAVQPGGSTAVAEDGTAASYHLLAMYDGSGGNVAVTGSPAEGCLQWPNGSLMVTWKGKDGSGSRYDEKGKLQQRWGRADLTTMAPVEVALGAQMQAKLTPSTGELLLSIKAKGLSIQLSTKQGALTAEGGSSRRTCNTTGPPAAVTRTGSTGTAQGGKARSRVQPGNPSSGGAEKAGAASSSMPVVAAPSGKGDLAAAEGAGSSSAAAVEPPGPEELQALLARAKALMASSEEEATGPSGDSGSADADGGAEEGPSAPGATDEQQPSSDGFAS